MDMTIWVQILNEAIHISHTVNTLFEYNNSKYSPSSYGLIVGQIRLFNLGMKTGLREEKVNSN